MKLLLFLLIPCFSIAQDTCNCTDIPGFQFSTNFKGITADVSHIAQKTKIGFGFGIYLYTATEFSNKEAVKYFTGDLHMHVTYKLIRKVNKYSLHALVGGAMDMETLIYPYGGLELRIPRKYKQFFIRVQYPTRVNLGIIIMP